MRWSWLFMLNDDMGLAGESLDLGELLVYVYSGIV